MVGQLWPEQQPQAEQAQGTAAQHIGGDLLAEEHPRVKCVPQGCSGEHHGDKATGNPLAGSEETHEIDAEQAQALGQADLVAAAVHGLQATGKQQNGEQDEARQGEAIDDRDRDGDNAQLELQGDPGGAPDQDGKQVE
ncbi:hypothetical protein D3C76_1253690 [compost metagenome]